MINPVKVFDKNIKEQFLKAISIAISRPEKTAFFIKALKNQTKAGKKRAEWLKNHVKVPPLVIMSITSRCNLHCSGCYSKQLHISKQAEVSSQRFREILSEARDLGISLFLIAGGEPLVKREFLEIASDYPEIIFPVFTNAMLIDDNYVEFFKKNPHIIPVISLEGREDETDQRRGDGVWDNFQKIKERFKTENIFWGISLTATRNNFDLISSDDYTKQLLAKGCSLFFFVEYVPIREETEDLVLTEAQKKAIQPIVNKKMKDFPALFVAFPGDEDQYDGCLAAGRGFFHINPQGLAEACPFAPFSDKDVSQVSIKEALTSPLFSKIRENHHLLKETKGGCALWANKDLFIDK